MSNFLKIVSVLFVLLLVFHLGQLSAEKENFKAQNASMMSILAAHDYQFLETSKLIKIYEAYQSSKDKKSVDEFVKRLIAMTYQSDTRITGLFGGDFGQDNGVFMNNSKIEKFLLAHPLEECMEVPKEQNLECNLEHILTK